MLHYVDGTAVVSVEVTSPVVVLSAAASIADWDSSPVHAISPFFYDMTGGVAR